MYIARHYVSVNGKVFTPGEVITENIDKAKVGRLLEKGAIFVMNGAPAKQESAPEENREQESRKAVNDPAESGADDADENDDAEDEEEVEVPEIDVTDGIVCEPEAEDAPAPRKRASKKK